MMLSSQKTLIPRSWEWWTASLVIGGSVIVGIFLVGFVLVSWQSLQRMSFMALKKIDTKTLSVGETNVMPIPANVQASPDERPSVEGEENILDDTSKGILDKFGVTIEPWMKSAESFESPKEGSENVRFLLIRGEDLNKGVERAVVYGPDLQHKLLDENLDTCSSVSATSTARYFKTSVMHSPCEAFGEYRDVYRNWYGEWITAMYYRSDASSFSFESENWNGLVEVSLTFGSSSCRAEKLSPGQQIWDQEGNVLVKTSITGVVIGGIFHKLPKPLSVPCGEAYGGVIVHPQVRWPVLDGQNVVFSLTSSLPNARVSIDVNDPEKVTFDLQ